MTFGSLSDLVRGTGLIIRADVEDLLPGVRFGYGDNAWVGTPTRVHVTDVIYDATETSIPAEPVVLQNGGTADWLTMEFEGESLVEAGADALVFAARNGGQPNDPSDYWVLFVIEVDPSGHLVDNIWSGVAPFLADMSVTEIEAAIRRLDV